MKSRRLTPPNLAIIDPAVAAAGSLSATITGEQKRAAFGPPFRLLAEPGCGVGMVNAIVDTTGALYAAGQRVHKSSARLQRRNADTKARPPCAACVPF